MTFFCNSSFSPLISLLLLVWRDLGICLFRAFYAIIQIKRQIKTDRLKEFQWETYLHILEVITWCCFLLQHGGKYTVAAMQCFFLKHIAILRTEAHSLFANVVGLVTVDFLIRFLDRGDEFNRDSYLGFLHIFY